MITSIHASGFTVLPDTPISLSRGVNVVIGDNGTGKSHLLKLAYVASKSLVAWAARTHDLSPTRESLQRLLAMELQAAYRPSSLGRLVSRGQSSSKRAEVAVDAASMHLEFSFANNSKSEVRLGETPSARSGEPPVFIPTQEMLSTLRGFAASMRSRELDFDSTYLDLALALESRPLRGKPAAYRAGAGKALKKEMGGEILTNEAGEFYFAPTVAGQGRIEIALVAEGIRKIGTLAYLLGNGSLSPGSTLFWDEPESSINPRRLKTVISALHSLAHNGVQVVLSTHSLFVLREVSLSASGDGSSDSDMRPRFIALSREPDGRASASISDVAEHVEPIDMLDAELDQSGRYLTQTGEHDGD